MNTEKEALQYLVGLGEARIIEVEGQQYSTKNLVKVNQPSPEELNVSTLTALVDYIKSHIDGQTSPLLIHVVSPSTVALYSGLRPDATRNCYLVSKAFSPSNLIYNRFNDTESFNIMLQSSFVDVGDKSLLLKVTGCIKDDVIKEIGDDGVSQSATIKTGAATVNDVKVPNPVTLAPYRTFPEVEQPSSKFIFRMKTGPVAAIFEADGGAWRNEAMESIKNYLKNNLADIQGIEIIS